MRNRMRALVAALGVVVALGVLAGPAFAQETPSDRAEARERGGRGVHRASSRAASTVDDCQKAPSPLTPEPNEIIWGSLAFLVLLVAMWKWGVPADQEHGGGTRDPHPQRPRGGREDTTRRGSREGEVRRAARRRRGTRPGASSTRRGRRPRRCARDLIARAEEEANEMRARAQADIANQRTQAMASCAPMSRRCRSTSRVASSSATSTTTPTASSSTASSTRSAGVTSG